MFEKIVSFENLLLAAKFARRGKRQKYATARFNLDLECELWRLQNELVTKSWRHGGYHNFKIFEPKERLISAASYRDRVAHHALHNILGPIFDSTFVFDSYATRLGKGTHRAIDRFQEFARRYRYVIKCDIKKYFFNIDRNILFDFICKKVACLDTLWMIREVLDSSTRCPGFEEKGIPIGNLTSQFFANIYLNGLDHLIKEDMLCKGYVRYMDDSVIFDDDKSHLWQIKTKVSECLARLGLELHENKCRIYRTSHGVPFFGMIIFDTHRRIKRQNLIRYKRRLKRLQGLDRDGLVKWHHVRQSVQSWIGHVKHANSYKIRDLVLKDIVFQRQAGVD
ncbi:MAG: group II intron reverse transcriptase domain-containing protein [Deltaproteobacteria bacterium]|nr:group II intron reverse transcriptase domain-containing protein [Deltaproteobacteria bacterium]